ncbi:MAG: signal peptidase II [Deltaproteobacteria bacterium]|nr:signal peptidase II [Deltaproteobacteria bacterium]
MSMKIWEKLFLVVLVLSLSVGCDQTTKRVAEQTLKHAPAKSMLQNTVRFHYVQNTGAFLSFGAKFSKTFKFWSFLLLPTIVMCLMVLFAIFSRTLSRGQVVMLMLIVGGGLGNLIDRLFFGGKVTDFVSMGIGPLRTGIFNVADVAIMFGSLGMFLLMMLPERGDIVPDENVELVSAVALSAEEAQEKRVY